MGLTYEQLTAGQPVAEPLPASRLQDLAVRSGLVRVVLDDDPTGTQSVADLPVLLSWSEQDFEWAFATGAAAIYVMTNSRSLAPTGAASINRQVATNALASARRVGKRVSFVSRSDSTLRGHFPLETNILADVTLEATYRDIDGVLIVPAYGEAGRITIDSMHYAFSSNGFIPVGESIFAKDATFGYKSSDLRAWVEEKTHGTTPASDVAVVSLPILRKSHHQVVEVISSLSSRQPCVVDIVEENDLRLLALAAYEVEAAGRQLLYRVGPPFVRALIGQDLHPPLDAQHVAAALSAPSTHHPPAHGGLIVVGSHVPLSTSQLSHLMENAPRHHMELEVANLLKPDARASAEDRASEAAERLMQGDVVISTSRELVTARDEEASLALSRAVSAALVAVVDAILRRRPPRFVIAKGGITSSDVARYGLHIDRALVVGPLLDGIVSLWQPVSGPAHGIPYAVFAGNVGAASSLTEVVLKFSEALDHRDKDLD